MNLHTQYILIYVIINLIFISHHPYTKLYFKSMYYNNLDNRFYEPRTFICFINYKIETEKVTVDEVALETIQS